MHSYALPKRRVLDFYAALSRANPASVTSILKSQLTPDFQWYGVYPFDEQHGPEAVAEAFTRLGYIAYIVLRAARRGSREFI